MKYPNGIKKNSMFHNINYKNRGMNLESDLNITNEYYREMDKAYIYKKPTPIKIVNVDYISRKSVTINEAYFMEPSTTDYNGIYKEKYIEFDAKECHSKASFPLSNVKEHQILHIRRVIKQKGIVFLIIFMNNEFYLFKGEDLIDFIDNNERKSIEYNYIKEKGYKISESYTPRLKYLDAVDKAYFN